MSEKSKQIARLGANSLSIGRGLAGPWLAYKFETTKPEERDWAFTSKVAALVLTDTIDGHLGRYAEITKFGTWADQLADKAFVLPPMIALAKNGEISHLHWQAKLGRDIGVTALRGVVHLNGGSTAAESLGKMKAVAEMTGLIVAASPASQQYPELTERIFDTATTLNIVSGAQYMQAFGGFALSAIRGENQEQMAEIIAKEIN